MNKFLIILVLLLVVVGCKGKVKESNMQNNNMGQKVLVAYFSYSGTTKGYAEK